MRPFDKDEIEAAASELSVRPALVEKEWHAVNAVGLIAALQDRAVEAHFSGGTSLSAAFDLTGRFSEDVDFKLRPKRRLDQAALTRAVSEFADAAKAVLSNAGYVEVPEHGCKVEQHSFLRLGFEYEKKFTDLVGMRPYLKVEMIGEASSAAPVRRDVSCQVTRIVAASKHDEPADFTGVPCVAPVETAVDKLSALTWRVLVRNREDESDDPTVIRHLYDLHRLRPTLDADRSGYGHKVVAMLRSDAARARGMVDSISPWDSVRKAIDRISSDKLYEQEYGTFLASLCFRTPAPPMADLIKSLNEVVAKYAS